MLHSNLDLIPSLEVPDEVIISCVVENNLSFVDSLLLVKKLTALLMVSGIFIDF